MIADIDNKKSARTILALETVSNYGIQRRDWDAREVTFFSRSSKSLRATGRHRGVNGGY